MVLKTEDLAGRVPPSSPRQSPTQKGTGSMRVRMKGQISGTREGRDWPAPGEEIDLPEDEAVQLLNDGMAEAVKAGAETATEGRESQETATAKTRKK